MTPIPTPIYHITHVTNLPSILADGCAWNPKLMRGRRAYKSIAHENIQDRRSITTVSCGNGGDLHDYVPFYFAPRSPMLYAIHRGKVASCPEGQGRIAYLVCTAQAVKAAGLPFVFSDGHGTMVPLTDFFDDLRDLDKIDWGVMKATYWVDTPEDGDRSRRRQAEFLIHDHFPWTMVQEIAVRNATVKAEVDAVLVGAAYRPPVAIRPGWYY